MKNAKPSPRLTGMGARIRAVRLARRLTLARLAAEVGTTHQHVERWEGGKFFPCPAYVERLCAALGCTPNYLFGCED